MRIKKIHINWKSVFYTVFLLASLVGVVFLMAAVRVKSSEQACTSLTIILKGQDSFIEQKDIEKRIVDQFGTLVGRTLENLPIHEIENDLKSLPYVQNASIHVDMNGELIIKLEQRRAVLRVINKNGNGFYVDEQGLKMPISIKYVPKVIVANGHIKENLANVLDTIQSPLVKDIFEISQFIQKDSVWNYQITQLYVNSKNEIELVPRFGDQKIVFGDAKDLKKKFDKLLVFYESIVSKAGIDAYKSVYLHYDGQIVCEKNPKIHPDSLRILLGIPPLTKKLEN